ncbi:MAG: hypothetical protein V1723_03860 [Candidatus Uhrbacteria bacterium]
MMGFFVGIGITESLGVCFIVTIWLFNRILGHERPSLPTNILLAIAAVGGLLTICLAGAAMSTSGEVNWSVIGVLFLVHVVAPIISALMIELIRERPQGTRD